MILREDNFVILIEEYNVIHKHCELNVVMLNEDHDMIFIEDNTVILIEDNIVTLIENNGVSY